MKTLKEIVYSLPFTYDPTQDEEAPAFIIFTCDKDGTVAYWGSNLGSVTLVNEALKKYFWVDEDNDWMSKCTTPAIRYYGMFDNYVDEEDVPDNWDKDWYIVSRDKMMEIFSEQ